MRDDSTLTISCISEIACKFDKQPKVEVVGHRSKLYCECQLFTFKLISCYLYKYLSSMQQYEFNDWRITAITSASGQPVLLLTFKFQTFLF